MRSPRFAAQIGFVMFPSLRRRFVCSLLFSASLLCIPAAIAQAVAKKTIMEMTEVERHELADEMRRAIDDAIVGRQFFSEDPLPIHVEVSVDPTTNLVIINVDDRFGPAALTAEFDDFDHHVTNALWPLFERIDGVTGVSFRFGGFDADHWPINRRPESPDRNNRRRRSVARKPLVFVSPGHGLYFHHKYKDWRAQREPANGVLEDDITPVLAGHLIWALQRDLVDVKSVRYEGDKTTHAPSGESWWRLSARYHLQARYPDLTDVWSTAKDKRSPLWERDEDIRSRPLYANHLNADALVHIHTNASASDKPNGLRTYIHGRAGDQALASKILCGARELIRTEDEFNEFAVSPTVNVNDRHAENNLARMPSVIVEVGFHTNPRDAEFLKNRQFQALAMRGVAKGYRLFRDNLPCADFAINPVHEVTGKVGRTVELPFGFTGNPVFPIRVWSKDLSCSGRFCHDKDYVLSGRRDVERLKVRHLCTRNDAEGGPLELTVTARDFDGVRTPPSTYRIRCIRN